MRWARPAFPYPASATKSANPASQTRASVFPRPGSAAKRAELAEFPAAPCLTRLRSRRSEEHTSELQSRLHLVCRLLLEKKKTKTVCSVTDRVNAACTNSG